MGGMRILVVDDDRSVRDALRRALTLAGYDVEGVEDGKQALTRLSTSAPAAVVLDIGLPEIDGLEVCRRLRGAGDRTPILMLTARDAVDARIEGLDAGADDYLVKPFDLGELLARLRAVIRRGSQPLLPERVSLGPLVLETRARRATIGSRELALTAKEYALLEYLVRRAGEVV